MLAVFARAVSVSYLEDTCRKHLSDYMPLDKTMPARGTHSFDPSWRGRGLRFSGSWSKAARTQSAMASASGVMVVSAVSGHGVVGGGSVGSEVLGCGNGFGPALVPSSTIALEATLSHFSARVKRHKQ